MLSGRGERIQWIMVLDYFLEGARAHICRHGSPKLVTQVQLPKCLPESRANCSGQYVVLESSLADGEEVLIGNELARRLHRNYA